MEEALLRFQYIGEEIFDTSDEKTLENCKKVCRTWKNFIVSPNQKFIWIKKIKAYEETITLRILYSPKGLINEYLKNFISGPKLNWSKLRI